MCALAPSTGSVHLSVTFGDGQTGTILVVVNGAPVAAGANLGQMLLGTVEQLAGKTAVVRSIVSRTNPSAEHFSVVHDVSASQTRQQFVVTDEFDESDSGSVAETITFS